MGSSSSLLGIRLHGIVAGEQRTFDLVHGRHLVGRASESDLQLDGTSISRRHAVLRHDDGELTVEDLGSMNGTYIDERRVTSRAPVGLGAILGFGSIRLQVRSLDGDESRLAIELPRRPLPQRPVNGFTEHTTSLLSDASNGGRPESTIPGLLFPASYQPGCSAAMTELYRQIATVAKGPIPVLLRGETGAGKEMIARILHLSSPRHEGSFVPVNCAAIPANLLEAELFGIGKAIATGVDPRPGLFLSASGGTLLLDEIGEMPLPLQAKLLRVLQEQEIRPVGGQVHKLDVRVVSATNADLRAAMDEGHFREDLYYRLAGDVLEIPPLRHCRDDVPELASFFLDKFSREIDVRPRGLSVETMRLLSAYPWPGNVRELENEIRRLVYRSSEGQIVDSSLLSTPIKSPHSASDSDGLPRRHTQPITLADQVQAFEAEIIAATLREHGGNRTRTAESLKMSRNGLLKKMKRLGIKDG